jgi:hypothetical protein
VTDVTPAFSAKGLTGRSVVRLDPASRAVLERAAQTHDNNPTAGSHWCTPCLRQTWRTHRDAACRHCCPHAALITGYLLKGNGHYCPQEQCLTCGHRENLRRGDPRPVFDVLLRDNTTGRYATPPCERCGAVGTELHHWAPRAIFNDADEWPTSWLCPEHHSQWHQAMRVARGVSLPREQRIGIDQWVEMCRGGVA